MKNDLKRYFKVVNLLQKIDLYEKSEKLYNIYIYVYIYIYILYVYIYIYYIYICNI